jgi:hypothetical protein
MAATAVTLYQVFAEKEWMNRIDDVIIMGLMTVAIVLFWVRRKYIPHYYPLLYLVLALITKTSAFFIEHDKPKEIAVDIVALCLILFGVIVNSVVQFVYLKSGIFII